MQSQPKIQGVTDKQLLGKPPLANRDHSANARENANNSGGGPRTQKSFRIHRTGKRVGGNMIQQLNSINNLEGQ